MKLNPSYQDILRTQFAQSTMPVGKVRRILMVGAIGRVDRERNEFQELGKNDSFHLTRAITFLLREQVSIASDFEIEVKNKIWPEENFLENPGTADLVIFCNIDGEIYNISGERIPHKGWIKAALTTNAQYLICIQYTSQEIGLLDFIKVYSAIDNDGKRQRGTYCYLMARKENAPSPSSI